MKMKMRNTTWNDQRNINTYPVKVSSYRGNFWCSLQRQNFANSKAQKYRPHKALLHEGFFTFSVCAPFAISSRKVTELLKFHSYFFNLIFPREVLLYTRSLFSLCQQNPHKHIHNNACMDNGCSGYVEKMLHLQQ